MELLNQMDGFDQNVNVKVGLHLSIIDPPRSSGICYSPSRLSHAMEALRLCGMLPGLFRVLARGSDQHGRCPCPACAAHEQ